jgi:hypothetical protein
MKEKIKFIEIPLSIYRCTVLVTWEQDPDKIIKYASKRGIDFKPDWKEVFLANTKGLGLCIELGTNNVDCLIWVKEQPKKASQYGVLYHEIYHAVDYIAEKRNMKIEEKESRAYIFEYIVNQCNKVLWK